MASLHLQLCPSVQSPSNMFLVWPLAPLGASAAAMLKVEDHFHALSWEARHYSKLHLPERVREEVLFSLETLWSRTLNWDWTYVRFSCQTNMSLLNSYDFFFQMLLKCANLNVYKNVIAQILDTLEGSLEYFGSQLQSRQVEGFLMKKIIGYFFAMTKPTFFSLVIFSEKSKAF